MEREEVEQTVLALEKLISRDDSSEAVFQKWFEENPCTWEIMGYRRIIPHPKLLGADNNTYIPDFMGQRIDGRWDIIEIKTPQCSILLDSKKRSKFYAEMESYVSQCREYSTIFDDNVVRSAFEKEFGSAIQKRPDVVLLAGMSQGLDRIKINEMFGDRVPRITHQTYDDILSSIEFHRVKNFSFSEGMRGATLHCVILLDKPPKLIDYYICDIGTGNRNRISIISSSEFGLLVTILDANQHKHEFQIPRGPDTYQWGELIIFRLEIGCSDVNSFIACEINGTRAIETKKNKFPFVLKNDCPIVMGSNFSGKKPSWMMMSRFELSPRTLTFRERCFVKEDLYKFAASGLDNHSKSPYLEFKGHKFLHSPAHPFHSNKLLKKVTSSTGALIQNSKKNSPTLQYLTLTKDEFKQG